MTSKQIADLPAVNAVDPDDQLLLSTAAGNLTRRAAIDNLPVRTVAGQAARRLAEKMAEVVSVKDYGAVGDGASDDSAAFQEALDANRDVWVPKGTYRLARAIQVKPARRLRGAGCDNTIIRADGAHAFTLNRNEGLYRVDPAATDDWSRTTLEALTIQCAISGILALGHEVRLRDLVFQGGLAPTAVPAAEDLVAGSSEGKGGGWAIEMRDANECTIRDVTIGKGGGASSWLGSGIALTLSRGTTGVGTGNAVNFGDGQVSSVHIKLAAPHAVGVKIDASGYKPVAGSNGATSSNKPVINNLHFDSVTVNDTAARTGTIGFLLKGATRCKFTVVDVEVMAVAWRLRTLGDQDGYSGYGGPGSNQYNTFVGCYQLNSAKAWEDLGQDGINPNSLRNTFLGNWFMGPLPGAGGGYGFLNSDENGSWSALRGPTDWLTSGSLWLPTPSNGQTWAGMRVNQSGDFYIMGDPTSRPGAGLPAAGMPKNDFTLRGLGVRFSNTTIQLFSPWGIGTNALQPSLTTAATPMAAEVERKIVVGNGPDFAIGFQADGTTAALTGELHRVQIENPLYLRARSTALPSASGVPGYGSNVPGIIINASTDAAWGSPAQSWFVGNGPYAMLDDSIQGGSPSYGWFPICPRPGFEGLSHSGRTGTSYAISDRTWFGKLSVHANSTLCTITINPDLIRANDQGAHTAPSTRVRAVIKVKSAGTGAISFAPANTNVKFYAPWTTSAVASVLLPSGGFCEIEYVRTGSGTVDCYFNAGVLQVPMVTSAQLGALGHEINASGKYAGKQVIVSDKGYGAYAAQGATAASPWKGVDLAASAFATVTPA